MAKKTVVGVAKAVSKAAGEAAEKAVKTAAGAGVVKKAADVVKKVGKRWD